jgi:hypothetical protein
LDAIAVVGAVVRAYGVLTGNTVVFFVALAGVNSDAFSMTVALSGTEGNPAIITSVAGIASTQVVADAFATMLAVGNTAA